MTSGEPTPCSGRFITDFVEHSVDCVRCADAALSGKVQCSVCGLAMLEKHLKQHVRLHSGEKPYRCAVCLQAFALKATLVRHLHRHCDQRPFACTTCGRAFRGEADLAHHLSVQTTERPFACPDCTKTFKLDFHLMAHKHRVHGYKYACRRCRAEFSTRNELVAHYVQHRKAFLRGPPNETD